MRISDWSSDVCSSDLGFLITSLLVEERARTGATSLRGFYGRRALRLLPALGALLIGTTAYVVVTGLDLWVHLRTCAMIVSYTSNWFFGRNAEIDRKSTRLNSSH